jgi:hypothetical protein
LAGDEQRAALFDIAAEQVHFARREDARIWQADDRELLQAFQGQVLVEQEAEAEVLIHAGLVGALHVLEPGRRLVAPDPVARAGAEVDAHLADGSMAEVHPVGARLAQQFTDAVVGHGIEPAVVGGFVDHGHERAMRQAA